MGAQTTEQGDCSRFKGNIPHCCKKDPTVVDLLPGTPYNQQIANCCKGGVINSWAQDPATSASSFQVSVGQAGTTNKTVRLPKNFTLKAPGPGYTCGVAKIVKPSRFISQDGRRTTQALSKHWYMLIYASHAILVIFIVQLSVRARILHGWLNWKAIVGLLKQARFLWINWYIKMKPAVLLSHNRNNMKVGIFSLCTAERMRVLVSQLLHTNIYVSPKFFGGLGKYGVS